MSEPQADRVLDVQHVGYSYGEARALDDVSFSARRGEVVALLGRNGAGKSTLLSIVAGLLGPDEGEVVIDHGEAGHHVAPGARPCGLATQDVAVYTALTVRRNLAFAVGLAGVPAGRRAELVDRALEGFVLTDLADRQAKALSGGERRRLHAAMACVWQPPLVLLDEPTAGVDVDTRRQLLSTIRAMAATQGTAVLYTTHYLPEVEDLGARVVVIDQGRVVGQLEADLVRTGSSSRRIEVRCREAVGASAWPAGWEVDPDEPTCVRAPGAMADVLAQLGGLGPEVRERVVEVVPGRTSLEETFSRMVGLAPAPAPAVETGPAR